MKALTLTQPWATLVMLGEKRVETRAVLFSHRGELGIHAAKTAPMFEDVDTPSGWLKKSLPHHYASLRHHLSDHDIDNLPRGAVLGTVDVVDGCRFSEGLFSGFPHCLPAEWMKNLGNNEIAFGDYSAGRAGLLLRKPRPFERPIPARGMNGLWNWEQAL